MKAVYVGAGCDLRPVNHFKCDFKKWNNFYMYSK